MTLRRFAMLLSVMSLTLGCASSQPETSALESVETALDSFHEAASVADEDRYFELIAEDGVFIGTDATERWTRAQFREYAHPHFSQGKGWTFKPRNRHIEFSRGGDVAWFDELLDSDSYGECRGTGVLQKSGSFWRVEQYHLTIPIPNSLADEVVARIRNDNPDR
jgi:ketosteroid isomerase-like protein